MMLTNMLQTLPTSSLEKLGRHNTVAGLYPGWLTFDNLEPLALKQ